MNKRYMDILKEYLKKNERKAIGYSEEEITKIEKLYDIEAKGDFREFLSIAGKSLGGLLGEEELILYSNWSVRKKVLFKYILKEMLAEEKLYEVANKDFFIISIRNNIEYFFIITKNNNLKVYYYNTEKKELKETGMNFSEYVADLIKRYNQELEELKDVSVSGDIINI